MSNQDIDGHVPPEASADAPAAPPGTPESLEQQLEKERDARALMRERLRHTEALAAESHALRARMAQELERVTAERDRLRSEGAAASQAAAPGPTSGRPTEPLFTPTLTPVPAAKPAFHGTDRPLKPPTPAQRKGPWAALAMLGVLAVAGAAAAWYTGAFPGARTASVATRPVAASPSPNETGVASAPPVVTANAPAPSATVATAAPSTGAVALPPLSPEAQLAAAPTAAGPAPAAATAGLPERLRKALDAEGIASPVDVDGASGHVMVADPKADDALRQRTEMVIRAVYAGAGLPEPQVEHRWLSPMRGAHESTASADAAAAPSDDAVVNKHPAALPVGEHRKPVPEVSVAAARELTPVLPAGRLTAGCMQDIAGKSTARRAALTACMKHSCCSSSANHNSDECRAYDKAYPFTCGGG